MAPHALFLPVQTLPEKGTPWHAVSLWQPERKSSLSPSTGYRRGAEINKETAGNLTTWPADGLSISEKAERACDGRRLTVAARGGGSVTAQ
jgi:hypothetical protein